MRRSIAAVLALAVMVLFVPDPASAQGRTLTYNQAIHSEAGVVIELGRIPAQDDSSGARCPWQLTAKNQHSVHTGNDILIRSAETSLTVAGVEDVADGVTNTSGSADLSGEVVVSVRLGADGKFSAKVELTVGSCVPEATTTTTEPATTTTTEAPTTITTLGATVAPQPLGPTVTEPPTTPTTQATTTVSSVPTTATTAPATTATTARVKPEPLGPTTLPVTGSGLTASLLLVGAALVAGGVTLTARNRQVR